MVNVDTTVCSLFSTVGLYKNRFNFTIIIHVLDFFMRNFNFCECIEQMIPVFMSMH